MTKKIVLLTGASSGIGEAIARKLVRTHQYFPLLVARRLDKLQSLAHELECDYFVTDITQQEQVKKLVQYAYSKYGQIDILINNAGYGTFGGTLETSFTDYQGILETNYLATVRLIQAILPSMLGAGGGKIINIASIAGLTGVPNLSAYSASKFALIGFSESLQLEYGSQIQVGILCPGPVQTPFFQGKDPKTLFPSLIARQLLDPETVANETIKLIDRPRVKVIPKKLFWLLLFKRIAPKLYMALCKKMYDSFFTQQKSFSTVENGLSINKESG
ncbi:SDR family NAD(P)-dependent oxidoreductase [Thermoflavimicrobium daqui]|jgi:short-subunit dehydrogenase|uniref:Oxidoreductase n=1 Tax=Thermoflavimicrobium daqui TaxID=2137476 RepID=A0A364K7T7_9BACL|nr:SDR family NAD(P)-dependent oxidoreductase [Thermoflavimicrobium daqui]RAL26361.1 oxidoreductase [Thermoflavimicrobium daqui]